VERSRETGLLVGRGSGPCDLIYLDAAADVELGDRVVTAGLDGPFPKGVVLGTVTRVVRNEEVGTARASVGVYTTKEDIDKLIEGIKKVKEKFK